MKKYLAKSKLKSVYVENGKATKVFAKTYNKSDVLYEALNTSRVDEVFKFLIIIFTLNSKEVSTLNITCFAMWLLIL